MNYSYPQGVPPQPSAELEGIITQQVSEWLQPALISIETSLVSQHGPACGELIRVTLARVLQHFAQTLMQPAIPPPPPTPPAEVAKAVQKKPREGFLALAATMEGMTDVLSIVWLYLAPQEVFTMRCSLNWTPWRDRGQLGRKSLLMEGSLETKATIAPFPSTVVNKVALGVDHMLVVAEGAVYSCGSNIYGQLGHGDNDDRKALARINDIGEAQVLSVSAGRYFSLFLLLEELPLEHNPNQTQSVPQIFACGCNSSGQLGKGDARHRSYASRLAPGLENTRFIAAGEDHAMVAFPNLLIGWGSNAFGQLGRAERDIFTHPVCLLNLGETDQVQALRCSEKFSIVLTTRGALGFGLNDCCQLGFMTNDDSFTLHCFQPLFGQDHPVNFQLGSNFTLVQTEHAVLFCGGQEGKKAHGERMREVHEAVVAGKEPPPTDPNSLTMPPIFCIAASSPAYVEFPPPPGVKGAIIIDSGIASIAACQHHFTILDRTGTQHIFEAVGATAVKRVDTSNGISSASMAVVYGGPLAQQFATVSQQLGNTALEAAE